MSIAAGSKAWPRTSRRCSADGHEVLIVSSGAIAIGSTVLGHEQARARLEDLQAAAAAGQVQLVHAYQEALGITASRRTDSTDARGHGEPASFPERTRHAGKLA